MSDHRWPLSATQQGIWLDEKRSRQGPAYSMPFWVTLDGPLDRAAFIEACQQVIARHPVLSRSVHEDAQGRPWLAPAPRVPEVVTADLRAVRERDLDARLTAAVQTEIGATFDLAGGPLVRLTLFVMSSRPSALLLVAHHLVFDRVSMDIFTRDLAAFYRSGVSGSQPGLPDLPGMRAQLAADSRWIAAASGRARAYWSARWRSPAALSLPYAARAAPGMIEGRQAASAAEYLLGPAERALLRAAADSIGVTTFEYLLASLFALLYRYGNQTASVSIALGQRRAACEGMIGPFVQEVPFTAAVTADMTFSDLARRLRRDLRELYGLRRFPLGLAVPGTSPAALRGSVSISYARHHPVADAAPLRLTWRFLFNSDSRSPVSISVLDEGAAVRVMLRYSPAFLDAAGAASIARQWRRVGYAGAVWPGRRIDELPLPDRVERARIMTWSAGPAAGYPGGTLPELFAAQAARTPGRIAAVSGREEITYARLAAEAARLASYLRRDGLRRGSVAAIHMRPSVSRLLTVLAVLGAGGAYLPLDAEAPRARIDAVIRDSGASVVLADEAGEAELRGSGWRVLRADRAGAAGARWVPCVVGERDLAYLIYTSGSTGQPKGVAVEHGALANVLHAFRDITGTGAGAAWLAHTSLAFDMAVLELYLPLICGGTVVIAQDHEVRNPGQLTRLMREHHVSHLAATPSGWQLLLEAGFDAPDVAALAGGETLPLPLARRLRPRVRVLWNAYGPTEATVWSTCAEIALDAEQVSIGRPIANTRAYILGPGGEIVPAGCAGELVVAGAGLARGYFRAPAPTAERFAADPFGAPGSRMYRTGDRARYRADGSIEFLGRLDDQVKVRGHRIELGEVEARLAAYPLVERCAVAVRGDEALDRRLVAFVGLRGGQPVPTGELRKWMAEVLPAYMLPAAYMVLEKFPLTASGKLDRASLPEPSVDAGAGRPAPAGSLEEMIRQVCQEVLRAGDLGLEENLFDAGANSLMIMQISRRIALSAGVDIPLEMLFEAPTVAGIARVAAEAEPQ